MEYYQQQPQYSATSHHDSFSSASSGSTSSANYGPFTPVSGRSSPASQRMDSVGSCEFDPATAAAVGAGSFSSVTLGLTPPPSAAVPNFFGSMAAPSSMAATMQAASTGADMGNTGYYTTSSSFSQAPATPDRQSSISSSNHNSVVTSPTSPAHMLSSSYPATLSPLSSVASSAQSSQHQPHPHQHQHQQHQHPQQNSLCSDGGYPFSESQRHTQHPHQHQQQPSASSSQPRHHPQASPPYNMFPTPPPTHPTMHNDCGEISPSEFYWQSAPVRQDSPIANMFEDRPSLPLPPPSVTLKSQSSSSSIYGSPDDLDRRYSMATAGAVASAPLSPNSAARRRQFLDGAQLKTAALQRHMVVGQQYGGQHHHSQPRYSVDPYGNGSEVGQIVVRNGIQVSKVASGAFKCLFNGCQAHPFKRSEHLKRHVMTHHENKDAFPCEFCGRNFNRKDNWRSHLKLHTVSRGKNARTDYFPKAVRVYEEEMRKVSKCRPRKDKMLYRI